MKIDGSNLFSYIHAPALRATSSSKMLESESSPAAAESDESDFSSLSSSSALVSQLKRLPDVRQQRVEALRNAIQSGRYHVSDSKIAEALYAKLLAPRIQ